MCLCSQALLLSTGHGTVLLCEKSECCVCNVRHLPDVEVTLESMLKPRVATLPGHIQSVYVQNICKLYGRVLAKAELNEDEELVQRSSRLVSEHLSLFIQSADLEVQERVSHTFSYRFYLIISRLRVDHCLAYFFH